MLSLLNVFMKKNQFKKVSRGAAFTAMLQHLKKAGFY